MSKNLHNYSFIFIITIFFLLNRLSCVNEEKRNLQIALDQAGSNKAELKKVIEHYSNDPAEHLKLKAARFLIRNMPYHSYQAGLTKFEAAFDSIAKVPPHDPEQRKLLFEYLLDSISKLPTHDKLKTVRDIEVIDAQFLIENIDLAFEAWNSHPKEKRAGFNTFCNYILPYRNDNVPLEREIRRKYFEKFHWAIDSLQAGVPFKSVADSIFETSNYTGLATIRDFYPIPLTASRYEKCRTGLCSEEVNYIICIFRALGITASEDFVPLFGNSRTVGHSFFRIKYGDEVYCPGDLIDDYKRESIAKVFRKTYSANRNTWGEICLYTEVTPEYAPVTDVAVDIAFNGPPGRVDPVLCLFQRDVWYRIAKGKQKGDNFLFDGIGINVLYLPAYYSSGNLYPVNYPFFILPDKTIHYYDPGEGTLDSVILLRKTGLKTPRADFSRKHWVDSLRYGIFQGANDPSFNDAQLLARITNLNSTHIQTISVINSKPFRYVRFWADNHSSFLSLLEFYDSNTQKLTGKIIKSNTMNFFKWQNGAFDDDPLTYTGGFNFTLGLELDKPGIINHIRFQSRNDDNHIRPGDSYELFYWDKNWRSLGMQTAADTLLTYHKVPENSIFWLRNLSRGREENVFVMDKSGKQVFLGFDEE
jgi:hypothetical protein